MKRRNFDKRTCKNNAGQKNITRYTRIFSIVFALLFFLSVTAYAQQENSIVIATGADVPQDTHLPAEYRFPQEYQDYAVQFLTEDGIPLCGYVLGDGEKGVTLAHANGWMVKSWLPFAEKLAEQGYQVILWEFRNNLPSGSATGDMIERWDLDVQTAAQVLRERGVKEIISMGCSYGGTATAVAAPSIPELKGLVILSSPCYNQQIDPADALSKIKVPAFFAVSTEDGQGAPGVYQREVESLYEACASSQKEIHIVEGVDHGTDMITVPEDGTLGYATFPETETQCENRKELEKQLLEFTNSIFSEVSTSTSSTSAENNDTLDSELNEFDMVISDDESVENNDTLGSKSNEYDDEESAEKSVSESIIAVVIMLLILVLCGTIFLSVKHKRYLQRQKRRNRRNPPRG